MNNSLSQQDKMNQRFEVDTGNLLIQHFFLFRGQNSRLIKSKVTLYQKFINIQTELTEDSNYRIQIDFDLVFLILRQKKNQYQQKIICDSCYGIRFQKYDQSIQILNFEQPHIIILWRDYLAKLINQKGFHQIFKPIKKIGKGNFASVYLVTKHEDNKQYAVKAFSKQLQFSDQRGKQALQNQIRIMRNLDDKNLMKLDGVYQTENSIYLVLQYISGGPLYDKIKKRHQFSTEQVTLIMQSLLNAVKYMHDKNIMHRDIKPENILFRQQSNYECVLADFGLATYADAKQYIYTRCGTPGYVAPQIVNLKNIQSHYQPVCDIFSLGVVFHILALGISPFSGTQNDEVLKENRECIINFQNQIYGRLHHTWFDLLKKMLQKDPSNRISAKAALQHNFFNENSSKILEQIPISKHQQCDSPLMITKNNQRKRNLKLRDDSCIKFKMKENLHLGKDQQQNIQKINSPLRKKICRNRTQRQKIIRVSQPSNFKQRQ